MPGTDEEPAVVVSADGPYEVTGLPLVRRRVVRSALGESVTWETVEELAVPAAYRLCRCGRSSTKPFCDDSHEEAGFDGSGDGGTGSYDERARAYEGPGVVMRDDRSICSHASFCATRATNAWKLVKRGATEDTAALTQVMGMVERCPSGALTYRLEPAGRDVEVPLRAEVVVVPDGPLQVTGGVRVELADGIALETRNRMTLCRCGQSANKPLCDGSHRDAGFTG